MVSAEISRHYMEEELASIAELASTYGWEVTPALDELKVTFRLNSSVDKQIYLMEFTCDDYKLKPPFIEFVHPETGERGTKSAYPKNGPQGGHFHDGKVCICAPFSRKAYVAYGGPHGDWQIGNWMSLAPHQTTIGDAVLLVQRLINNSASYGGRMG